MKKKKSKFLTQKEREEVKTLKEKGMKASELAELFDIHIATVYDIIKGKHSYKKTIPKRAPNITHEQDLEIAELYKKGILITEIAKKLNVSRPAVYRRLSKMNALKPDLRKKANDLLNQSSLIKQEKKEEAKSPLIFNFAPNNMHCFDFGTEVLDLPHRQLYVQTSHDKNNPRWVCLNAPEPEKKGIMSRFKGWFSKK